MADFDKHAARRWARYSLRGIGDERELAYRMKAACDRIDELEAALRAAEPWIGHGRAAIGAQLLVGDIRRQVRDALRDAT